jgi:ABC-type transport system involved in cytochrome bd biosynthesis fused ATPase/permease subunit
LIFRRNWLAKGRRRAPKPNHELHNDGQTIVVVTHEPDVAAHGQRIVRLKDGKILEDRRNERGRTEH